jgi:FG-GAP-like repeat
MKRYVIITMLILPILIFAEFPNFELYEITQPGFGNPGVYSGDINNDGMMDIVATVTDPPAVKWYQNIGYEIYWYDNLIASVPALYVCTAFIDEDDYIDVLVSSSDNRVLLFINPGENSTDWAEIEIAVDFMNPHGVDAADIDGDGDLDVLATSQGEGKICWWEQDGDLWLEHLVSDAMPSSQSACLFDLDNDDDCDIIGASSNANDIAVWLNDGESEVGLTQYTVEDSFQLAHWVSVRDLNGDGLPDILGAAFTDHEVAWWENNGDLPNTWPKHSVSTSVGGACTAIAEDMDNDGDADVLATAWGSNDVYVWENLDGTALNWTRHTISSNTNGVWAIHTAKLDNDDDFDIICGSDPLNPNQIAAPLSWWENDLLNPARVGDEIVSKTNHINIYPNPFNPTTTISFNIANEIIENSELVIYNIKGQKVRTFPVNLSDAEHRIEGAIIWNGIDSNNHPVSSGIYYCILKQNDEILASKKMMLLK